jgi:chromosome segregation ATPase
MLEDKDEIMRALGRLEGTVKTGVEALKSDITDVKDRLDKQNGVIADNQEELKEIKSEQDQWKGRALGAGFVAGAIGSLIGIGLAIYNFMAGK